MISRRDDLSHLDRDLVTLSRLADLPGRAVAHDGARIEVSTLLVVDVVSRAGASACDIRHVAGALRVAHSTASRLVDRAVAAGMVSRTRSQPDTRRTLLALTAEGARLQRDAAAFRAARLEHLLRDWPDRDVATFARLLDRFVRAADDEPPLRRRMP